MQEVEANAFAAAFLLPKWIVNHHCKQQGWTDAKLRNADIVYQLSLRAGLSYQATCWTLNRHGILSKPDTQRLVDIEPKDIKKQLLGSVQPDNYHTDVWAISERDQGYMVQAGAADYIVLQLPEHSSSGYLWRISAQDQYLSLVTDDRESVGDPEDIGGQTIRKLVTKSAQDHSGQLTLFEERPWNADDKIASLVVPYEFGSEKEGLSRAERRQRLEAA